MYATTTAAKIINSNKNNSKNINFTSNKKNAHGQNGSRKRMKQRRRK